MTATTKVQRARRQEYVLEKHQEGYGASQIARACGVEPHTISDDLDRLFPGREHRKQVLMKDPPLLPFDWRSDKPAPKRKRRERKTISDPVGRIVRAFIQELKDVNYRNSFGHSVAEAVFEEDETWISERQLLISDLLEVSGILSELLGDEAFRVRMIHTSEGRDDLGTFPGKGEFRPRVAYDVLRYLDARREPPTSRIALMNNVSEALVRKWIQILKKERR